MRINPTVVFVAALTLVSTACGSTPATTVPPTTVVPSTTTRAGASATLRGGRYCEVLLVRPVNGAPVAEVYNTYPLNDCPAAQWKTLDPATIAAKAGALLAVLNGPRYWLMDTVEQDRGAAATVSFGGIEMIQRATVDVGAVSAGRAPYTPSNVNRRAVFGYHAGSTVYELVAPDRSVYVMQSWSQQVDPDLDEAGLAQLGTRLELPSGWSFRVRVLTEELKVVTVEAGATVLQDELRNSYSKVSVAP